MLDKLFVCYPLILLLILLISCEENQSKEPLPDKKKSSISAFCGRCSDSTALAAIFLKTEGANWDKWLSNEPIEQWVGVNTDSNGRVNSLNLAGFELRTAALEEISKLTLLKVLDLQNNYFEKIPSGIGNLSALTSLNMKATNLKTLPQEIVNIDKLTELNVEGNYLCAQKLSYSIFLWLEANDNDWKNHQTCESGNSKLSE